MKPVLNSEKQLLLGRLLTRSGDQAWDFVIPFALLHAFPGRLQIAALYYLILKTGTFVLTPTVGKWIDSTARGFVVKTGIWAQFFAVLAGMICFWFLDIEVHKGSGLMERPQILLLFSALCLAGILASLGSLITDISVGNDLAPALVPSERLTSFNSWLRRIDLGTEVGGPVLAGLLFSLESPAIHLLGLMLIAAWNLTSFIPEYLLLKNVLAKSGLADKKLNSPSGWRELFKFNIKEAIRHPLFLLIFSYALLWLSVLSPHGVLLTGYLKDKMALPEGEIGLFRGLGALFGLVSTVSFPWLVKKWGLIKSSKSHLGFQALTLTVGMIAFHSASPGGVYIFLLMVLLSRVGLYGFSNGEFELRQRLIPEERRGELNSFSSFMTTLATLILFVAGSLLPGTEDFKYLVYVSLGAVFLANLVFFRWAKDLKA
jgi:iron-regulated transporter 1